MVFVVFRDEMYVQLLSKLRGCLSRVILSPPEKEDDKRRFPTEVRGKSIAKTIETEESTFSNRKKTMKVLMLM